VMGKAKKATIKEGPGGMGVNWVPRMYSTSTLGGEGP
jgi:hypothetical protein